MYGLQSRELESKQLDDIIAEVYKDLHEIDEVLSAPDGDNGIFKYTGTSPQAQYYFTRMSKKRDAKRPGVGFVVQRAELPDKFRISLDLEISGDVTGKDPQKIVEALTSYSQNEYGMQAPTYILYLQPAHSGKRGWANKTFVGVEIDIADQDFNALNKLKKRIETYSKKLFQAVDYALTEY